MEIYLKPQIEIIEFEAELAILNYSQTSKLPFDCDEDVNDSKC